MNDDENTDSLRIQVQRERDTKYIITLVVKQHYIPRFECSTK